SGLHKNRLEIGIELVWNIRMKKLLPTMAISNCLFSPTSENPRGFSVWCVLAKLGTKTRNYS
ncbi:hypothetical protein, partial [Aequorivita sinensis]|uniref:hypothetical protein n=1 Tax=Aequorivita sinensis TaxID=1382458 RepID=UPI002490C1D2